MIKYLLIILCVISSVSFASFIEKKLTNQKQELQAEKIFREIRCLVCDGESINDSKAKLAFDMRYYIREKIAAGLTKEEIIYSLRQVYGDEILMKSPLNKYTFILWFLSFLILVLSIYFFIRKLIK